MKSIKSNITKFFIKLRNWIMSLITLTKFDGTSLDIESDEIFTIIEEGGALILVYKNGTHDRFPALDSNLEAVSKIRHKLQNKPR